MTTQSQKDKVESLGNLVRFNVIRALGFIAITLISPFASSWVINHGFYAQPQNEVIVGVSAYGTGDGYRVYYECVDDVGYYPCTSGHFRSLDRVIFGKDYYNMPDGYKVLDAFGYGRAQLDMKLFLYNSQDDTYMIIDANTGVGFEVIQEPFHLDPNTQFIGAAEGLENNYWYVFRTNDDLYLQVISNDENYAVRISNISPNQFASASGSDAGHLALWCYDRRNQVVLCPNPTYD